MHCSLAGDRRTIDRVRMSHRSIPWPHAPTHQLEDSGTYFVTAGTYRKLHHFRGPRRLEVLHRGLLKLAEAYGWGLDAWSVFSNHSHFVAHSPATDATAASLAIMLAELHVKTSTWVNRLDGSPGRTVWHNFYETRLTYQRSYLARLSYTHENAVKHGLVPVAHQYPWCSAAWFERTAPPARVRTLYGLRIDRVRVLDDFEPAPDW